MPYHRPPIPGAAPVGRWRPGSPGVRLAAGAPPVPGLLGRLLDRCLDPVGALVPRARHRLRPGCSWHSRTIDANIHRLSEVALWHVKRLPGAQSRRRPRSASSRAWPPGCAGPDWLQQLRPFKHKMAGAGPDGWSPPSASWPAATYRIGFHLPAVDGGLCQRWLEAHVTAAASRRPGDNRSSSRPARPASTPASTSTPVAAIASPSRPRAGRTAATPPASLGFATSATSAIRSSC